MDAVWYMKAEIANKEDEFYLFSSKEKVEKRFNEIMSWVIETYGQLDGYVIETYVDLDGSYLKVFGDTADGYDYGRWEWGKKIVL